jgi:coiled-coil and C2 domain-containing protein 2A
VYIGIAIPEGDTAYVLTRESGRDYLWNPQTGERYDARLDTHCPLQEIRCVIKADNIYANIQSHPHPMVVDYDVTNKRSWKPLFVHPLALPTVQPELIPYEPCTDVYVNDLRDRLESQLKNSFAQWRSERLLTISWNRPCIQKFRMILKKLEQAACENDIIPDDTGMDELNKITATYDMSGYPINMPYIDNHTVIERVRATGIHLNATSGVEFALCVHVQPYSNNVLSVWIYVAALIAKHRR